MKQTSSDPLSRRNIIIELRDNRGTIRCPICSSKIKTSKNLKWRIAYDLRQYLCKNKCINMCFTGNELNFINFNCDKEKDRFTINVVNFFSTKEIELILPIYSYHTRRFPISKKEKGNIKNFIQSHHRIMENLNLLG